jgi:hypothetical protein
MQLTLFDRWTLEFPEGVDDHWFLEYVLRSPRQAGIHLTAGKLCYERLDLEDLDINSAFEVFGGIGGQSLVVEDLWHPMVHIVNEYDINAVESLHDNLGDDMTIMYGDAYRSEFDPTADLISLDFGDLTAWKLREGLPHRVLLDKAFSASPKAVLVTDIASRYLHLHRQRYESLLGQGTCGSYSDYLQALRRMIEGLYGYKMLIGYMHGWSTVMAFTNLDLSGEFMPTPELANALVIR